MMNEKQFVESQKDCATMPGMSLSEYQEYCKNLKVPTSEANMDNVKETVKQLHKINKNDVPEYLDNLKASQQITIREATYDNEFLKCML